MKNGYVTRNDVNLFLVVFGPVLSTLLCVALVCTYCVWFDQYDRLPIRSNVQMASALVSFLRFLLTQAKKQETLRKGGWLLYCIAFQ